MIEATIGLLKNNKNKLICHKEVLKILKKNISQKNSYYDEICGDDKYNKLVEKWLLNNCINKEVLSCFTLGGTGALNLVFSCLLKNKNLLVSSLRWRNYDLITEFNNINIIEYQMFDSNNKYNLDQLFNNMDQLEEINLLINDPCNNPTGYSLTLMEWYKLLDQINVECQIKKVNLIIDAAYLDYSRDIWDDVLKKCDSINSKNFTLIICYSFSKTLSLYGYRVGELIGIFNDESIKEEFYQKMIKFIRSNYSSANHLLTSSLKEILEDKTLILKLKNRLNKQRYTLRKNANNLISSLKNDYNITNYKDGYFVYIRCEDVVSLTTKLNENNIKVIPYNKGIRISIASINNKQIKSLVKVIKNSKKSDI